MLTWCSCVAMLRIWQDRLNEAVIGEQERHYERHKSVHTMSHTHTRAHRQPYINMLKKKESLTMR
jgi:hypothetical protein